MRLTGRPRALLITAWACVFAVTTAQAHEVHGNTRTTLGQQVVLRADAPSVSRVHSPRALYVLHCAGCHCLDGSGSQSARVPDMRQLGLFLRVPGGREFLLQVPGVMGSGLSDMQVAEVSNWVLNSLAPNSIPPGHVAYSAAEVRQARRAPLTDVSAARAVLVQRANELGLLLASAP